MTFITTIMAQWLAGMTFITTIMAQWLAGMTFITTIMAQWLAGMTFITTIMAQRLACITFMCHNCSDKCNTCYGLVVSRYDIYHNNYDTGGQQA